MAEESYDEEVLLENSPLSKYLQEACPDKDFETTPAVGDKKRTQVQTNRNRCDNGLIQLRVLKGIIRWTFEWIFPPVSKFIEDVNAECLPQYSSLALDSRLLLDTDRQMIQAYCPKRSQDTRHRSSSHRRRMVWMCGHVLGASAILSATLSVIVPYLSADPAANVRRLSPVHFILCLATLLSSTAHAFHWTRACWTLNGLRRLHRKSIECTGQCLRLLDHQGVLLKRSVRYIQEVEVISRGFTMASQYTPIVRLENTASSKQHRQCIVLRRACFCAARALFHALRDATLTVMKQHPLVADSDHVSNFLAMIDLDDFAPWIKVTEGEEDSQDSLSELTGCYCLAVLKAMNSLFLEQRSEFIRRLVLCTCPDARLQHPVTADALSSWLRIVRDISASCESSLEKLQRSYDCHRQRPSHNREEAQSGRLPRGGGEMQAQDRVNSAIRSLRLHLEVTLNRVISVEETLEGSDGDHQAGGDGNISASTSEMLAAVKRELAASQDCLQEAVLSLEKMNSKELSSKQYKHDGGSCVQPSNINTDNREPILLLPMGDTEIEFDDQIFEAYTDTEPWERCEEDWGEGISDQEKMRRRREADETKRLLQELRSVLSVRKAERERMKYERNFATQRAESDVDSADKTRDDDKVAALGFGTEDKRTRNGISENGAGAVDTILANKDLDSLSGVGNSNTCDAKDSATVDFSDSSVRATEDNSDGLSRGVDETATLVKDPVSLMNASDSRICATENRMVDFSRDVCENAHPARNDCESLANARGLSTSCTNTQPDDVEPKASSVCVEKSERSSQAADSVNGSHTPGCIFTTTVNPSSPDDRGHVTKNQSTDGRSGSVDSVVVGLQYIPTEGQKLFGLSLLPSLAAEAARISRQRRQEEDTIFGSDEDGEDLEEIE